MEYNFAYALQTLAMYKEYYDCISWDENLQMRFRNVILYAGIDRAQITNLAISGGLSGRQLRKLYELLNPVVEDNYVWPSGAWSDKEVAILREHFPIGGARRCQLKGIDRHFSHIASKAAHLGLRVIKKESVAVTSRGDVRGRKFYIWTDKDIAILKKHYPKGGAAACQEHGVRCTKDYIYKKAARLGLGSLCKWTDEQLQILKDYYPKGGIKLCRKKGLDRTTMSIRSMIDRLELVREK